MVRRPHTAADNAVVTLQFLKPVLNTSIRRVRTVDVASELLHARRPVPQRL